MSSISVTPASPTAAAAAASGSSSASTNLPSPTSPPPTSLPSLGVEFPEDHPVARRASKLQAANDAKQAAALAAQLAAKDGASSSSGSSNLTPLPSPSKGESFQAHLLEQFSQPLSVPNSPAEQARRMSINPSSRRNSILAIPPIQEVPLSALDHLPAPGTDVEVDIAEIEKEIDEIDTIG